MNRYEIRVVGHVDTRRAKALGVLSVRCLPDASSTLTLDGDQAAVYGLLSRCRDAGLELVGVHRLEPAAEGGEEPEEG